MHHINLKKKEEKIEILNSRISQDLKQETYLDSINKLAASKMRTLILLQALMHRFYTASPEGPIYKEIAM